MSIFLHQSPFRWTVTILATLLLTSIFFTQGHTQVCNGNVTLNTQADVNTFACTSITGNLEITSMPSNDIHDLSPLSSLTSVGGDLFIGYNTSLENIDGLSSLTSVGGEIIILLNRKFKHIDGLSGLTSLGGHLTIMMQPGLENIDGLSGLTSTGGSIYIVQNDSLKNINGLSNLASVGGNLNIEHNIRLLNLGGLGSLDSVAGSFRIFDNDILNNIMGVYALRFVGGSFTVAHNPSLGGCCELYSVLNYGTIVGPITIIGNGSDCTPNNIQNCRQALCAAQDFMPGNVNAFSMLLNGIPGASGNTYSFESHGGTLETFDNGTAHLYGRMELKSNPSYKWDVDVWFVNKMDWPTWQAMGRTYKGSSPVAVSNYTDWSYYEWDPIRSRLKGVPGSPIAGAILRLTANPPDLSLGFQTGLGANDKNGWDGASSWFQYSGTYSGNGDFNLATTCNAPPKISMNQTTFQTPVNTLLTNDLSHFVTDPDGGNCTFQIAPGTTGPSSGSVNLQSNGQFTYIPNTGFQGQDTFMFVATDAGTPSASVTGMAEISIGNSPFPVTWISFEVKEISQQVALLIWEVSNENFADYYSVERSGNAVDFFEITQISAKQNQSNTVYTFQDQYPMDDKIHYRLRQVDMDGTFTYSPMVEIHFSNEEALKLTLAPNPVNDHLKFQLPGGVYCIKVRDITGRTLLQQSLQLENQSSTIVKITPLPPGMYFLEAMNKEGNTVSTHFLKQ